MITVARDWRASKHLSFSLLWIRWMGLMLYCLPSAPCLHPPLRYFISSSFFMLFFFLVTSFEKILLILGQLLDSPVFLYISLKIIIKSVVLCLKKNSIVIGPKRFEKQHGYNAFVIPSSFYIVHEKEEEISSFNDKVYGHHFNVGCKK